MTESTQQGDSPCSDVSSDRVNLEKLSRQIPAALYQLQMDAARNFDVPFLSPGAEALLGYDVDQIAREMSPEWFERHVVEDDLEGLWETVEWSTVSGKPFDYTYRYIHPDPSRGIRWIHSSAAIEALGDDQWIWHGVMRDVTEGAERARECRLTSSRLETLIEHLPHTQNLNSLLHDSEERLRSVLASLSDLVVVVDRNRRIIDCHYPPQGPPLTVNPHEFVGKHLEDLGAPDEVLPLYQRALDRVEATGQIECFDYTLDDDKGWRALQATVSPRLDRDGGIDGLTIVVRDITEQKRHEKYLQEAKEKAEATTQARSRFVAHVSHEVRTPINAVLGVTELLAQTDLSAQQQEYLDLIRASADVLLGVAEDVLDFSRNEAARTRLECDQLNLEELCESTAVIMAEPAASKGVDLEVDYDDGAPRWFVGDARRLRQVLLNLVGNAVKFTHQGRVCLRVRVRAVGQKRHKIRFEVADTGIGISAADQEHLFEAFARVDHQRRFYQGTGLGLAICKQLVELMEGTIGVQSARGEGATFWFEVELPGGVPPAELNKPSMCNGCNRSEEECPIHWTPLSGARKVLLVDDDRVNVLVVRKMLEKDGCEVEVAQDGLQAVEKFKEQNYDLVLMDCQMPNLDGYGATRRIREWEGAVGARRHTPVVALTASVVDGLRSKCLDAGMDDLLSKPVRRQALLKAVHHWSEERADEGQTAGLGAEASLTTKLPQVFDHAHLRAQLGDDDSFIAEVVQSFLTTLSEVLPALNRAAVRQNFDELRRYTHQLRGAASNAGALSIAEAASQVEESVGDVSDDRLHALILLLREEAMVFRRLVTDTLAGLSEASELS
ncbi:response regulator [Persicimonas caeni]|uniref:histidine kinase n=1 Tax=Persicimonas caeni TaxID=2292766 RepID=A0A4Y6PSV2_PERCE|nr:ATP-binding protein [Persicimonas caeni]QDG51303.1 response regulator [Persicimonas caeni]QED32524.1 response regulator [Persicimonas caeni]